ncbi:MULTISPECIES: antitoxin [Streptomycetaceae]|uniref:Antitoxin n=1 Tax=Streptantibioticus cattleyicolor (strain ATCC 35852 / DSM 46488 / JCM 4925 / NBRC 14057 / NRRL 8057) TaxID=1003195 RepID=F8JUT5_STREN|nr:MULTISPECIES: antitoxin [Streptomycetaceae]AEW96919.1 hypothetical protein SCATT_45480 [Streptantibioticus cattleyicolor NRRL 8057 = DSM 46488]MYS61396.1 antitoxin [Streptomyces sp. SID5468]CCB77248.1 conserved protein of unknown function [Streptantibioticus cattleyicolor NRRL 8057 = DSM 46488]
MGFLDTIKGKLNRGKAEDLARQHGDQVKGGMDKAGGALDERTGGKYGDQIRGGEEKAKGSYDEWKGGDQGS